MSAVTDDSPTKEPVAYKMTKIDYDHIRTYDGNPQTLWFFLKTVQNVYDEVCADDNTHKKHNHLLLLSIVIGKLKGEVLKRLSPGSYTDIHGLLQFLKNTFQDPRSIEELTVELFKTKPYPKEHPIAFIDRLGRLRCLMLSRLHFDDDPNIEEKMKSQDRLMSLHVLNNLHPRISDCIAIMKIRNNLETDGLYKMRSAVRNNCSLILEQLYGTIDPGHHQDFQKENSLAGNQRSNYRQNKRCNTRRRENKPQYDESDQTRARYAHHEPYIEYENQQCLDGYEDGQYGFGNEDGKCRFEYEDREYGFGHEDNRPIGHTDKSAEMQSLKNKLDELSKEIDRFLAMDK